MATITAANYEQHKPVLSSLSREQRTVYDLLEEYAALGDSAQDVYNDPDNAPGLDDYFASLDKQFIADLKKGKAMLPDQHPYIAFYKGKRHELHAPSKYAAQQAAATYFKLKPAKSYEVQVELAQEDEPAVPAASKARKPRKATGRTPKGRKGKALPKRKPKGPELNQVKLDCRILESDDECVVEGITPGGDRLRFVMQEHESSPTNEDDNPEYSYTVYAVLDEGDDFENAPLVGKNRVATMWAKKFGPQVIAFYEAAIGKGLELRKKEKEQRLSQREKQSARKRPRLTTPPPSSKPAITTKKPTKAADIKPKKPAKAKTARTKKAKPADTRKQVSHLSNELLLMRSFLALTEKPVTQVQVRNLHRKLEKAIASRKVRISSEHAAYLRDMAELTAKTLEQMVEGNIVSVKKLDLRPAVVANIRTVVQGTKVSNAVGLLSRFINLQGQQPEAKAVSSLLKSLEKEHAEHPKSDYVMAVGAAAATLRDWKPGRAVGISAQQLGRLGQLSGLGCACQDAAPKPVAGAPAAKRAAAPARTALGNVDAMFTVIGEKDHRQASGNLLHLPGDLGRFLGNIEDHEYALAIRGEKGAGKTRFLYQLKNLFAGIGKRVASFSLEIGKNSDVVLRNTEAYIAPNNRARVMIASEAAGLDTIRQAAKAFDVVAIDSWGKIPGVQVGDFDKIRKEFPNTLFLVIFQSTTNGTSRGGSSSEYDASAVCQVNLPGVAVMEKNRYATGAADELKYLVNEQRLANAGEVE